MLKLIEIIGEAGIKPRLKSTQRDEAIAELVDHLVESGRIDGDERDEIVLSLLKREALATTGMGAGVAVPHIKLDWIDQFVGAVGVSRAGVDFYAVDGKPVYAVFLFLSPDDDPQSHLGLMARIGAICQDDNFLSLLREAKNREELAELLEEAERLLLGVEEAEEGEDGPSEDSGDAVGA